MMHHDVLTGWDPWEKQEMHTTFLSESDVHGVIDVRQDGSAYSCVIIR